MITIADIKKQSDPAVYVVLDDVNAGKYDASLWEGRIADIPVQYDGWTVHTEEHIIVSSIRAREGGYSIAIEK